MKQTTLLFLFFFGALCARAQFADTTALNKYINDNIRDKRPEKVTADQLRVSLLGLSSMIGKYIGAINQNYIENRVSPAQSAANFNIDGTARAHVVRTANLLVTDNSAIIGGVSYKIQTFTGNTVLDYTNYSVLMNNSGSVTITLPLAVDNPGAVYFIKKISAVSNNVIVDGDGSDTVDGGINKTLTLQNSCIMVQSDGVTNWVVLSSHVGNATL